MASAPSLDRRRALLVLGAVSPCVFGCIGASVDQPIDDVDDPRDPDQRNEAGASPDDPSSSGPPTPGEDAGGPTPPSDAGGATPHDSGAPKSDGGGGPGPTPDSGGSTGGGGGGGGGPSCPTTLIDAGPIPGANSWKKVTATRPFILGHDAGGVYAFSAKCTHHTSVTIGSPNASGVSTCPSHGAQFDSNGTVIRGPASSSLVHYAVTLCAGRVYVDTSKTVSSSDRQKP
jgi:nitrite reductase/ring-hydroxylating ferredoxin subunit